MAALEALRHPNFFGSTSRRPSREFSLQVRDPSRTTSAQDDFGIWVFARREGGSVLVFTVPTVGAVGCSLTPLRG